MKHPELFNNSKKLNKKQQISHNLKHILADNVTHQSLITTKSINKSLNCNKNN